jgi:hypothetical protein
MRPIDPWLLRVCEVGGIQGGAGFGEINALLVRVHHNNR